MTDYSFDEIGQDLGFTEGPLFAADDSIIVTSISHGKVYRRSSTGGPFEIYADTGGGPNGATIDKNGTVLVAQNGGKPPATPDRAVTGGVQAIDSSQSISWETRDVVSPNDLCIGPNDHVFITDPTRRPSRDDGRIWRLDRANDGGEAELLCSVPWYPNGIGFGADDRLLYVADTTNARIRTYELDVDYNIEQEAKSLELPYGTPDGFAFDAQGNLIVCAIRFDGEPGELQVFDSDNTIVERIRPGTRSKYTNVALHPTTGLLVLTESDGGRVLVCDGWPSTGMPLHPLRTA